MYKYFVVFSYVSSSGQTRFGNAIVNVNIKIEDMNSDEEINHWLINIQNYIKTKQKECDSIIITNFKEISK